MWVAVTDKTLQLFTEQVSTMLVLFGGKLSYIGDADGAIKS